MMGDISLKAVCREMADHYTWMANKLWITRIGEESEIIDISGTGEDLIGMENASNREFELDGYGVAIGVREDGKYYELTADRYVRLARRYRRFEREPLLRALHALDISLYYSIVFPFARALTLGISIAAASSSKKRQKAKTDKEARGETGSSDPQLETIIGESNDTSSDSVD